MQGWKSPLLGVRFVLVGKDLELYRPDGKRFLSYEEQVRRAEQAEGEREYEVLRAEAERVRADLAGRQRIVEQQRAGQAENERQLANQRAEAERLRAEKLETLLQQLNPDLLKSDDLA